MRTLLLAVCLWVATAVCFAQNPQPHAADPGPLVPDPRTGFEIPSGCAISSLFSVPSNGLAFVCKRDFGTGVKAGDLLITYAPPNHVLHMPMKDGVPQAGGLTTLTRSRGQFASLDQDGQGNLYAAGSGAATQDVFQIHPDGTFTTLNTSPIPDPDAIAVGAPPGANQQERLYVAAQDLLMEVDLTTGVVSAVPVDLQSVGGTLGNWQLQYDDRTRSILGHFVAGSKQIEIDLSTMPAKASNLGPGDTLYVNRPDARGTRYFTDAQSNGFLLQSTATPAKVPLFRGPGSAFSFVQQGPNGSFYVLSRATDRVYRLDRPLNWDTLVIDSKTGGTTTFTLRFGGTNANKPYRIFASLSGASPGTPFGKLLVPLNVDVWTFPLLVLSETDNAIFKGWNASLDGGGEATATFTWPPATPVTSVFTMHTTCLLLDVSAVGNAAWLHLTP